MGGTYAKLVPDAATKKKIASIVNLLNIANPSCIHDLHLTVVYSRVECQEICTIATAFPIIAHGVGFELFTNQDNTTCLVLRVEGNEVRSLHESCRDFGATHDYPEYNPHITLSYDYSSPVPNDSVLDHFKDLQFEEFVVEPLDFE